MEKRLYDMMHWGRIEAVVYAEEDKPYDFLGAHRTENGTLIQAYYPDASGVSVLYRGKEYPMECADENGFFAVLLSFISPFFKRVNKATILSAAAWPTP